MAKYVSFSVGSEASKYKLSVSGYDSRSTGGDGISYHNGMKFTTFDVDNDRRRPGNCAYATKGGYWYNDCTNSNPTGLYLVGGQMDWSGINWYPAKRNNYSFKFIKMTLVPR